MHLTDDEAIELILDDIVFDYGICTQWALEQSEDLWERYQNNNYEFNINDIELSNHDFRVKFGLNKKIKVTLPDGTVLKKQKKDAKSEFAHHLGMPVAYSLNPFIILLINEHPEITESFLFNFELNDKNGHLVGVFELDNGIYLKGYKLRKSGEKSEQTIKLNDTSKGKRSFWG